MVRPSLRNNMVGIPETLQREHLHLEGHPLLRNLVPEATESGPSTRIFDQLRERGRERQTDRERET
jgi:hypothetical protein